MQEESKNSEVKGKNKFVEIKTQVTGSLKMSLHYAIKTHNIGEKTKILVKQIKMMYNTFIAINKKNRFTTNINKIGIPIQQEHTSNSQT